MRRLVLSLVAVSAVMLMAGAAQAQTLKLSRAKQANASFTQQQCADSPSPCYDWNSGPCARQSAHQVTCHSTIWVYLQPPKGEATRCDWDNTWKLRHGSNRLHRTSTDVSCQNA